MDQYYDMNLWAFTTNLFQAFDVPLTNGLNSFTFHAADFAGNVTVANFSVTLDYSGKPTPQVQVNWPLDGGIVCGSNFVCWGLVSDPTATVALEITDSFGDTNSAIAAVGRNGDFYAENLPLTNGANGLTITVTDAAGNVTNISLTITQGDSGLNIDAVAAGQTNVTGEIGSGDYTIWVNDILVTNVMTNVTSSGTNYSWSAQIAPIGVGAGTIIAMAYPNSHEDELGMRSFAMADSSTNSPQGQGNVSPAPSGVYISSYQESDQQQYYPLSFQLMTRTKEFIWQNGKGGSMMYFWTNDGGYAWLQEYSWPATSWPDPLPTGLISETELGSGITNTYNWSQPPVLQEHCNISFTNPFAGTVYVQRGADTQMTLATGGMPGSTNVNLWLISCTATNHSLPWVEWYLDWGDWAWYDCLSNAPINPQNIRINGHNLDSNGNVYVVLPDNTNLDVTPVVLGTNGAYYTYTMTASVVTVTITPAVPNATIPWTNYQRIGINGNTITNRAQAFTAAVTPSTETNSLRYYYPRAANGGQVLPSLTSSGNLLKTNLGNGVLTFSLVGTNASKNNGDARLLVQHLAFTSQGTSPQWFTVGIMSNTVIVPAGITNPSPLVFVNPVGTNVALGRTTVPTYWDYLPPGYDRALRTTYGSNVTVPVRDQFGNPCGDLYDGSAITESNRPINQTLTNSAYQDSVGISYRPPPNFPRFVASGTPEGQTLISNWAAANVTPLQPTLEADRIGRRIEVDGFPMKPDAQGRTLTITTNPPPPQIIIHWPPFSD